MTTLDRIRLVMKLFPTTRNDDFVLWVKYLEKYESCVFDDMKLVIDYLHRATQQTEVVRCRAIIQNGEGQYLPTCQRVARARKISVRKWERWIKEQKMKVAHP